MPTRSRVGLFGDQPAMVDDRDPVAKFLGFFGIMGRSALRSRPRVERLLHGPELLAQLDIDSAVGLVEHEDRR